MADTVTPKLDPLPATVLSLICLFGPTAFAAEQTPPPDVGRTYYREMGELARVRHDKSDGVQVIIDYRSGRAQNRMVLHPKGHPLKGKVQPLADGKTLHTATLLLPTIIKVAKGEEGVPIDEVMKLFEDYPEDLYSLPFKETPGRWRLSEGGMLFLKGYTSQPHARNPVVCYWGPAGPDALGDDRLYCGYWELDKTCLNLPLKFPPDSLHRIKSGETVEFLGCKLHIDNIEHDNDRLRGNNLLTLSIEGLSDVSKVWKTTGTCGPIKPEDFIREVCFPRAPDLSRLGANQGPLSVDEIKKEITRLAHCKTNRERAAAVKKMLHGIGYTDDEIKAVKNPVGMEDIWVIKRGESKEIAFITTYYDKIGEGSQGVIDNGVGVIVTLGAAKAIRHIETKLSYAILFWGGEEINYGWGHWLLQDSDLKDPIRYAAIVKGYGLRGCQRTLNLDRVRTRGWLHWSFPMLKINSTGGDPAYQKHTARDNLSFCDFDLVKEAQDSLVDWMILIDQNL